MFSLLLKFPYSTTLSNFECFVCFYMLACFWFTYTHIISFSFVQIYLFLSSCLLDFTEGSTLHVPNAAEGLKLWYMSSSMDSNSWHFYIYLGMPQLSLNVLTMGLKLWEFIYGVAFFVAFYVHYIGHVCCMLGGESGWGRRTS